MFLQSFLFFFYSVVFSFSTSRSQVAGALKVGVGRVSLETTFKAARFKVSNGPQMSDILVKIFPDGVVSYVCCSGTDFLNKGLLFQTHKFIFYDRKKKMIDTHYPKFHFPGDETVPTIIAQDNVFKNKQMGYLDAYSAKYEFTVKGVTVPQAERFTQKCPDSFALKEIERLLFMKQAINKKLAESRQQTEVKELQREELPARCVIL